MTNPQVEAARRATSKFSALGFTLEVVRDSDGSETHTPVMPNGTRGEPVTITRDTPVSEVTRLFTQSLKTLA